MRALTADDPEDVGGLQPLARLGAGGMGVVYLARTAGGALVALKVIRAEHAADPAFRARFRREVAAVRGLTGPWLVPVVAADPEARTPWLATEFVPGPALSEVIDGYGALPLAAVRTLGSRLADALAAVHAAGLVHRDVKPGNVLLALDGPRLIDFGIAHTAGATALTAPDAVVGTPGFLSPEQARARAEEVGPPSDVFALGCVLAHAAGARRPFGAGNAAGVLFRTVHEEPDLAEVPAELRALIGACLAKDPGLRPTAARVAAALRDPRTRPVRHGGPGEERTGNHLPPAVLRMVAERSARALDVPAPRRTPGRPAGDHTALGPPPSDGSRTREGAGAPEAAEAAAAGESRTVRELRDALPPNRRRVLLMGGAAAAVVAVGGGITAYLAAGRGSAGGSGDGLPVHTLGFQADMTGDQRAEGVAQERGARLAVERHNARTGITFRLALDTVDDRGDATRAERAARRFTEAGVCAVLGPVTETAARAAAPMHRAAGTAMVLVSLDDTGLESAGRILRVTRAPESRLAIPLVSYLSEDRPVDRTAVIDDRAAGPSGPSLTSALTRARPNEGATDVRSVAADSDDFRPAVRAALDGGAQAVVFSGTSSERAARCARALDEAGFTGPRLGTWHIMRPDFLRQAEGAGRDWLFAAPFTDPGGVSRDFRAAYRAKYGSGPGRWAPEAYDAVGLVARALTALGGTADVTPPAVAQRLSGITHRGIAKTLTFADGTFTPGPDESCFLFEARGNTFRLLGR
ncbi:bifunctional serine/threonine-protein kinase/ABC transporter substrate-binding protein [Streptomyces cadmiisoli]|uniref:bifunctional serine/threonine-protein kinase/ABC transporter substrate-binding protein n=1 Tax=Streptomyces cadmiisoli TaxID=2184053 RepID=UPI003D72B42D